MKRRIVFVIILVVMAVLLIAGSQLPGSVNPNEGGDKRQAVTLAVEDVQPVGGEVQQIPEEGPGIGPTVFPHIPTLGPPDGPAPTMVWPPIQPPGW